MGVEAAPNAGVIGRAAPPRELLAVNPLVRLPDEVGGAMGEGEIAAAVADERAHGDVGREVARGLAVALHDEHAAVGAAFDPAERFAVGVPARLAQADAQRQALRRNRAGPEAEHSLFFHPAAPGSPAILPLRGVRAGTSIDKPRRPIDNPPMIDLDSAESLHDPAEYFGAAREAGAVQWSDVHKAWMAVSHEEVEAGFRDTELLSADRQPSFQRAAAGRSAAFQQVADLLAGG